MIDLTDFHFDVSGKTILPLATRTALPIDRQHNISSSPKTLDAGIQYAPSILSRGPPQIGSSLVQTAYFCLFEMLHLAF